MRKKKNTKMILKKLLRKILNLNLKLIKKNVFYNKERNF